jgi:hypothetical protein
MKNYKGRKEKKKCTREKDKWTNGRKKVLGLKQGKKVTWKGT